MRGQSSIFNHMRRGSVEAFVLYGVGLVLLFLMHTILGRTVGPRGYGVFSYAVALTQVLAIVVPLGWPTALMRFVAQYTEQQRWSLLRGAVRRAYQVTLASTVVCTLILWAVSYASFVPQDLTVSLRFSALLLPLLAFVGLRSRALQGLKQVKASIVPEQIVLPLLVILGAYTFAITSASGALLLYAGAALVAFLVGNALLWRSLPTRERAAKPEFETRAWMIVALPMIFGGLSQIIMNRTDVLMLGVLDSVGSVGLYSAANRFAILNTFTMTAVGTIAVPLMTAAFHGSRLGQARSILRWSMIVSMLGALPLTATMVFFPGFLLGFFGPEFAQATNLLRILAVGQFINAATGPIGAALQMTGRERTFAWATGSAALFNVVGNLIMIPRYGASGAAAVTALSVAGFNISLFILVWGRGSNLRSRSEN